VGFSVATREVTCPTSFEVEELAGSSARGCSTLTKLSPGDFLLFFTDGIIEMEDKRDRDFGIEGLQQSIRSNVHQPTESLLEAIISDVYNFAGSRVLTDDACLVVAELQSSASPICRAEPPG
jgi:Stage II sporulation protein E (SpoIIE)